MSVKLLVFIVVVLFLIIVVACYTRFTNIDNIIRRNDKPLHAVSINVYNLDNRFTASSFGEGFIINDKKLRFFSSCIPPVMIKVSELKNGNNFYVTDSAGKQFLLGKIKSTEITDNSSHCMIDTEADDEIVFKSSYSMFPYYYGFFILSSGPVSRYYHYYSLSIKKKSDATLLLDWKFSTYKGADGKLVPDLFGDNKEGLIGFAIK